MKIAVAGFVVLGLLLGGAFVGLEAQAARSEPGRMAFGMDAGAVGPLSGQGARPDYATLWIGPWTLTTGWGGPRDTLAFLAREDVTPAIHLFYWGDDISRACLRDGCWSSLHGVHKSPAGWQRLTGQLVDNLNARMGGKPVVVILETEFNKGDVETFKGLDRALADKAAFVKAGYPNAHVVLGLGNWNRYHWSTWTEAAAKSDSVGIQGMRASTRDSLASYLGMYEETLAGARDAQKLFGKPVFVTDIGLSSYPASSYENHQAEALGKYFAGADELKSAGVHAMVYRAWFDQPFKDTNNYYGQAERYWGLVKPTSGAWKPAATAWVDGVKAERAGATPGLDARFTPSSSVNEWWVDVKVDADKPLARVDVRRDAGSWVALEKTGWGTWAKSVHTPKGSSVQFRATTTDGARDTSDAVPWLGRAASGMSAGFTPSTKVNEWWVDVIVRADKELARVDVRVDDGSWGRLPATEWGSWAKAMHVPRGSEVRFRATASDGDQALSSIVDWLDPGIVAQFAPARRVNEWWVEVQVEADRPVARLDARVGDGSWVRLGETDWGTYAKSLHAPRGAEVTFRATATSGDRVTSDPFPWLGSSLSASFRPSAQGNPWWVETAVEADGRVTAVAACVDGGACTALAETAWGTWAESFHVPAGTSLQFRATTTTGDATSEWFVWG